MADVNERYVAVAVLAFTAGSGFGHATGACYGAWKTLQGEMIEPWPALLFGGCLVGLFIAGSALAIWFVGDRLTK